MSSQPASRRFEPNSYGTPLRLNVGEDWPVPASYREDGDSFQFQVDGRGIPVARLRRIGWLDQRGRVWLTLPSTERAGELGCGSFTPLLIDVRET